MEPVVGIEPTTDGLQNRCSTTELHWHQPTIGRLPQSPAFDKAKRQRSVAVPATAIWCELSLPICESLRKSVHCCARYGRTPQNKKGAAVCTAAPLRKTVRA